MMSAQEEVRAWIQLKFAKPVKERKSRRKARHSKLKLTRELLTERGTLSMVKEMKFQTSSQEMSLYKSERRSISSSRERVLTSTWRKKSPWSKLLQV